MAPDPIRISRIGGVDIIIKDHLVLDRTLSSRTEFSSRMSFSKDRIVGYKGKEKELLKALTPQEIKQQGLINSDSFYEESEEDIKNLKEALNKIEAILKVKEECKYEYVQYKPIQMNMEDKKDMQNIIKELINLGLIESGVSANSSPGFLDLARYRKDFRSLLKEIESSKWKWDEIHTQRVRELKQVCNDLPKLAIPQDEDELVVYTDANDYRWATVLMKRTTNSIMLRFRHLRENLDELNKKFGRLAVNAQVAGQIQRANLDTVQITIRTAMVASTEGSGSAREALRKRE
ncbi:UNVERIFIED_CONTAM: hypothetical protein Sradi_4879400 [Sesamum radiatum]|uniref:Reverse transcriptase/retrotransposon-derived protein RNase H-like domain-containing protein n=1 Tax=Sesamum radiatum TaxID=300843 RepID=A0AAW2MYS7_SESRA